MRKRSRAREFCLQVLYQIDVTGDTPDMALAAFWSSQEEEVEGPVREFCSRLVKGVSENMAEIDSKISQYATNWQLKRMAFVDRNILRMVAYELIYCSNIPAKVSINEGVELAKKYSGLEASRFVNGVLDKVKSEYKR